MCLGVLVAVQASHPPLDIVGVADLDEGRESGVDQDVDHAGVAHGPVPAENVAATPQLGGETWGDGQELVIGER